MRARVQPRIPVDGPWVYVQKVVVTSVGCDEQRSDHLHAKVHMTEEEVELVSVEVRARCDCGGYFVKLARVGEWPNPNATYPHRCNLCHVQEWFKKLYPTIEYRPKPKPINPNPKPGDP